MLGTVASGVTLYSVLLAQQYVARSSLPDVDPRLDVYSKCIGKFLSDMTTFVSCLDRHASKKCIFNDNRMTNAEDSHGCLALISPVPHLTANALAIRAAHDVCYIYLRSVGECLGLAVEMADFEQCFRKEVFVRVGAVVERCRNLSHVPPNEISGPPSIPAFAFQGMYEAARSRLSWRPFRGPFTR